MVEFVTSNLLHADAEALVNTVNTTGVMGTGVALPFKHTYPEHFEGVPRRLRGWRGAARAHVRLRHRSAAAALVIVSLPTNGHWKWRARLADIDSGPRDLRRLLRELDIA